ncbi:site-2 protease family protein [Candidatus Microgenomates bacterium]|nr:MAG: site-2 protease family protein [Candidatus Microgenomates bacterium]
MLGLLSNPISLIISFAALVVAITIHEFSHAWMADHLGDPTPRLQGRLTLNPLAHLDPIGTLMILLVRFGWGKPVQFDPFNLQNPRRDAALISIAGPISNIVCAIVASVLLHIIVPFQVPVFGHTAVPLAFGVSFFINFLQLLILINVILAVFNLIPIHPLDGFKIVGGFLSQEQAKEWYSLERYGIWFLLLLLLPIFGNEPPISRILSPALNFFLQFLLPQSAQFI